MTPRKKPVTPPPSELYRLAEIMQMQRVDKFSMLPPVSYFQCRLCYGVSEDTDTEIRHDDGCPINRLK